MRGGSHGRGQPLLPSDLPSRPPAPEHGRNSTAGGARLQTVSVSVRSGSHWLRLRAASLTSEPAWAHLCNGGWEASALRVVMWSVLEYVKGSEMFVSLFFLFLRLFIFGGRGGRRKKSKALNK